MSTRPAPIVQASAPSDVAAAARRGTRRGSVAATSRPPARSTRGPVEPPPRDRERQHEQDADVPEHRVLEDREAEGDDRERQHADDRPHGHERARREQRADAEHVPERCAVGDRDVDEGQHRDAERRRVVEEARSAGLERALDLRRRVQRPVGHEPAGGVDVGLEVEGPGVVGDVAPDAVDERALAETERGDDEPEQAEREPGRSDEEERAVAPGRCRARRRSG